MEEDVRLLGRHAAVSVVAGSASVTIPRVARAFRAARPDVVLLWFAHPTYAWAVVRMARLFGVRSAIVTGGYDVACMPELGFGAMRKRRNRPLVRAALRGADVVLPFSQAAAAEVRRWAEPKRLRVIYPAVDLDVFRPPEENTGRAPVVVTASAVNKLFLRQKGIDTFLQTAALVPEARFILVGREQDDTLDRLRRDVTRNVEFVDDFLPREDLVRLFQHCRVYLQASLHEGFGLATAEAMACGAIPVGAEDTALREVIGDAGYLIPSRNPEACARAVRAALAAGPAESRRATERVARNFSLARRERELVAALEETLAGEMSNRRGPMRGAESHAH
jgi:glycosyltransferase involved in cell wall biosynthesis